MMKKIRWNALLLAAALWLSVLPAQAAWEDESGLPGDGGAYAPIIAGITLVTDQHVPYAAGSGSGFAAFRPNACVTRAEAAQMLFRLLPNPVTAAVSYTDVPPDAWYAEAALALGSLGVIRPDGGVFAPDEEITRGEFVRYVACFFPLRVDAALFADVPEWSSDAPYIRSARASGWVQGSEDGLFHPEETITRAETVAILNRALGRTADREYIDQNRPVFYVDVSPHQWFYYDVIEASAGHTHTEAGGGERWTGHAAQAQLPAHGLCLVDGWLYYFDSVAGDLVREGSVGGLTFNREGRFTSGSAQLDQRLHAIVLAQTSGGMSQEEMLRALYLYTRDSFTYLRRPAYAFGATGFMEEDALNMLKTGYGNCYSYASLFWYLSRWIGYDARIYSGTVGQNSAPHCWVEISFDGVDYIFDTELEMAYRKKGRTDINLYKFVDTQNKWDYVRP